MARTANQSDDSLNAEQLYSLDQQSLRLATANGIPEKVLNFFIHLRIIYIRFER